MYSIHITVMFFLHPKKPWLRPRQRIRNELRNVDSHRSNSKPYATHSKARFWSSKPTLDLQFHHEVHHRSIASQTHNETGYALEHRTRAIGTLQLPDINTPINKMRMAERSFHDPGLVSFSGDGHNDWRPKSSGRRPSTVSHCDITSGLFPRGKFNNRRPWERTSRKIEGLCNVGGEFGTPDLFRKCFEMVRSGF